MGRPTRIDGLKADPDAFLAVACGPVPNLRRRSFGNEPLRGDRKRETDPLKVVALPAELREEENEGKGGRAP